MTLTEFLRDLLTTGELTVAGRPPAFEPDDLQSAVALLQHFHAEDCLHLPYAAPPFEAAAALWGAQTVYYASQLTVLRDLDEQDVHHYLVDFPGAATPGAVYSADLTLRYLPDLLHLAKGLAPADALVARLQALASQWPFSFAGTGRLAASLHLSPVLADAALRNAYADRIIRQRDLPQACQAPVAELVRQALGLYAAELWPEFHRAQLAA